MFRNYAKIFIRNLGKQKVYSFINIFGLSVGLAVFILVLTYFNFNLSFDSYHKNSDRIYLVTSENVSPDGSRQKNAYTFLPLASMLVQRLPEVENATVIRQYFRDVVSYEDKKFYEKSIVFADPNFLKIFNYPVIAGDKETPLLHPNSVVLTKSAARKYFGDEDPIGKILKADFNDNGLIVTAVINDCPLNSINTFNMLVSLPQGFNNDWGIAGSTYTFVKLKPGANAAVLDSKLRESFDREVPALRDSKIELSLFPLKDIHLKSMEINSGFNITTLFQFYLILAIAIGLLIIVSINFMILSTSRYTNRAKEVGIRKVVGAARKQLILQYIGESMVLALIALPLALVLYELIRPAFIAAVGGGVELSLTQDPAVLIIVIAVTLFVGFVSGIYPAFFLSSFQAASVIKIRKARGRGRLSMRKILVVLQFALTFTMIVSTLLLMKQLNMMSEVYLGYDRDNILGIPCTFEMADKFDVLEKELKTNPNISMVADGHVLPFSWGRQEKMRLEGTDKKNSESIFCYPCGYNFIEILNIKIAQGRSFSRQFNDQKSIIISEETARHFHMSDPIGKKIILDDRGEERTIVGVAKDFHFPHVIFKKAPAVIYFLPSQPFYVFVKTVEKPDDATINFVRAKWNEIAPTLPFDYFILENQFQDQLRTTTKSAEIFEFISITAVLIASLGLFALAAFTAEKRTKEIGIRKVLGASSIKIIYLLVSEFLAIVVISDLIALPFAYYLSEYLMNIAWVYKTDVSVSLFLAAATVSIIAALSAVGIQSVKSALANPIEALRYE
jgi:putative ABC transport system permease protein